MGGLQSWYIWLIDVCQIAFFMSCLMLRNLDQPFCRYFLCHLSYRQQFFWYPGYHGYQFYAALYTSVSYICVRVDHSGVDMCKNV